MAIMNQASGDPDGLLAVFNERARALFNMTPSDVGRPIQNLEVSYHPVELRSLRGVVLSGSGHDGTDGVQAMKAYGGTVVVQDEATSEHFGMPTRRSRAARSISSSRSSRSGRRSCA
jgi:hypothetical protein